MPLHPQAQAFVDHLAREKPPGWEELGPEEARVAFNGFGEFFGKGPQLDAVEDMVIDGDVPVRVYKPGQAGDLPVVMFFHGGGWVLGSVETHDALCRHLAKLSGAVVVSVDYGLSPENAFPGPLDQCYRATRHVSDNAADFGIHADRLFVAGDSAGGNLAAAVAIRARDEGGPSIAKQILIYPVIATDFETTSYQAFAEGHGLTRNSMIWFWRNYLTGHSDLNVPLADLRNHELAGLPPALVLTAEYDVLRDEGEDYADRLESAGVTVQRSRYDGMLHGFVHFAGLFDSHADALAEVSQFIR